MINISKSEALALTQDRDYDIAFGYGGVSSSKSKKKKYYLCDSKENLEKLDEYRKSIIVKQTK